MNRITDREMVYHPSLSWRQAEIAVHFFIIEGTDTRRPKTERFRRQIQPVAYGSSLEMHVAITAVTMGAGSAIKITDHRKRHACVTREILPET